MLFCWDPLKMELLKAYFIKNNTKSSFVSNSTKRKCYTQILIFPYQVPLYLWKRLLVYSIYNIINQKAYFFLLLLTTINVSNSAKELNIEIDRINLRLLNPSCLCQRDTPCGESALQIERIISFKKKPLLSL
jgi:hypothetical protein